MLRFSLPESLVKGAGGAIEIADHAGLIMHTLVRNITRMNTDNK